MKFILALLFGQMTDPSSMDAVSMKLVHMSQQILGIKPSGPDPVPGYSLADLQRDLAGAMLDLKVEHETTIHDSQVLTHLRSRAVNYISAHIRACPEAMENLRDAAAQKKVVIRRRTT